MEYWGYAEEAKKAAKQRRRANDKSEVIQQSKELDQPQADRGPLATAFKRTTGMSN